MPFSLILIFISFEKSIPINLKVLFFLVCLVDLAIDRISWNVLNVFYDILVISKIDFTELFKNDNYGFHNYIS